MLCCVCNALNNFGPWWRWWGGNYNECGGMVTVRISYKCYFCLHAYTLAFSFPSLLTKWFSDRWQIFCLRFYLVEKKKESKGSILLTPPFWNNFLPFLIKLSILICWSKEWNHVYLKSTIVDVLFFKITIPLHFFLTCKQLLIKNKVSLYTIISSSLYMCACMYYHYYVK